MTDSSSRPVPGDQTPGPGRDQGGAETLPDKVSSAPAAKTLPIGEYVFSGLCLLLGIVTLLGTSRIPVPDTATTMGPQVFPYIVGALLAVTGLTVFISVVFGSRGQPDEGEDIDPTAGTDWLTVLKIVAFFLAQALLLEVIGWPLASALLFFGVAWSFGARKMVTTAIAALVMGLLIQLLFGSGLGLSLPAGPLLDWIPIFSG